ncbi:MAG: hypothetical protein ACRBDL_09370 [Alphaproteobacteria bacterium]
MFLSKRFPFLFALIALGGCSYAVESSHQDITFLTPGAMNAKCYVMVHKLKYQVYPPQMINVKKSPKDMEITCHAPGNRVVKMTVPAELSERAIWGGPVGVAWDYASQSLHYYPSVIAIDFSQEFPTPNPPPHHNNNDIVQPENYDLEEFSPSAPRLNSDKDAVEVPLLKRGEEYPVEVAEDVQNDVSVAVEVSPQNADGVVSETIDEVIQGVTDDVAQEVAPPSPKADGDVGVPSVAPEEALSEPVQIYPGQ